MNSKFISTSDPLFLLPSHSSSSTSSLPQSLPNSQLSFKPHLRKQRFPIKTSSRSQRFSIRAVAGAVADPPTTESFYDLLGVSESGSLSEIKRAYKRMALKYHPDVSPPDRTEEYTRTFIRVQEAYQTLSDSRSRAMYDSDMAEGLTGRRRRGDGSRFDTWSEEMGGWRSMWQSQIDELQRKSMMKSRVDSRGRATWGSRVRKQRI